MLKALRRFLADDDGFLVAQDWAILATILLLGSVLALMAARQALEAPPESTNPRSASHLRSSATP